MAIARLSPDVVALQEVARPGRNVPGSCVWKGSKIRHKGTLIWARPPLRVERIRGVACRTELYLAARVFDDRRVLLDVANVWVKPFKDRPRGECEYGFSLERGLKALLRVKSRHDMILLGDFNIINPESKDHYRATLARRGLFSAYHAFFDELSGMESRITHLHRTKKTGHHQSM